MKTPSTTHATTMQPPRTHKEAAKAAAEPAKSLPRFPAGPSQLVRKVRLPAEVRAAVCELAARLNLRAGHVIELAVANQIGWHDRRTDAIRAHVEAAMARGALR